MTPFVSDAVPDAPDADVTPASLMEILTDLSLPTNLLVALDAAELASYPGTGVTWNNLVTIGPDFYLGDDQDTTRRLSEAPACARRTNTSSWMAMTCSPR